MQDLNEVLVFVKVVDQSSVSGAARLLDMPKSTVSRRISSLEKRLGVQLLLRTTRQLRLTDAGRIYYERGREIIRGLEEAEREVTELQDAPRGQLRISAPPLFGDAFLGPIVTTYLERYPETTVLLDISEGRVDLLRDGFDVVVRAGVLPDSSMVARRIGDPRFVYVASPVYLASAPTLEKPDDLRNHQCILYASAAEPPRDWHFGRGGALARTDLPHRLQVNNFTVAMDAALAGLGVAGMPAFVCAEAIRNGALVEVLAPWAPREGGIWVMFPENRHMSAKLRAFVDLVTEIADGDPPWNVSLPTQP